MAYKYNTSFEHIKLNGECVPKFQADTAPSRSTTPTTVLFFIIGQRNSHYSQLNIAYSMLVLVVERYWQEFAVGGASEGVQGIASLMFCVVISCAQELLKFI